MTLASDVTYEPFGPLASLTYGNGLVMTRSYDADYRITGITTKSATATVQNLSLSYDLNGNVTSIIDNLTPGDSQTFTYDALNRLTTASGDYPSVSYTYDADSNRLTSTQGGVTQTYSYSPTSDQVLSVTSSKGAKESFTYTGNGNIATDRGGGHAATYVYSSSNRLVKAAIGGDSTASYLYNALGERMSETVGNSVTDFLYDQNGNLITQANGKNGIVATENVWLGELPLAEIENGKIYYIQSDQTNTPQIMTNAAQKVVWNVKQQPFGQIVSAKGTVSNDLRFAGQIADAATGLNYNMMRDYDPTLGQYIEADPSGLAGGTNLYEYAACNPIRYSDPFGLAAHLNLINPSLNDPALVNWATTYLPNNYNTVVVHTVVINGVPQDLFGSSSGLERNTYTPSQLAVELTKTLGYDPDLPTILVACQAATTGGAQELANELQQTVLASPFDLTAPGAPSSLPGAPSILPGAPPVVFINNQWQYVEWIPFSAIHK